ncbi:hypothetical protein LA5095_06299 [Roseibium album]|uniref:Arc-like DNA binding domain-containing protein n=1 Tax=Roseibium album TaxID=311410 RepID=A0A0M7B269_9HYPH|nr:hypothetical protein LA5094_06269 [Roseibium album]CTQ79514.1 hypothetical protein LA5096_06231 [Roseibium album]CTQ81057.1 hypothetical protein LA5095_06299 [Roseibium album]
MTKQNWPRVLVRLPVETKRFLESETQKNASSLNSEIVRCIRHRMDELNAPTHSSSLPPRLPR